MKELKKCWCGNANLHSFSPEYLVCLECNTLVSQVGLDIEKILVNNDAIDFYGKEYWFNHQIQDLAYPDIIQRSRTDLTERCLYWLRTLLKYKLSPAKSLELGCSHGGFVALLREAGYDASGLEMSPWIVDYARKTFNIPMLQGPLENQTIPAQSLDIISLFDVMEHLSDPRKTIAHCFSLLKQNGILIIQMPNFQPDKTYSTMLAQKDPFLMQLKATEHLFLFSKSSVTKFFHTLGEEKVYIAFEPAIFSQYDMFLVVSREPFQINTPDMIDAYLNTTSKMKHIQALLDLANERDTYIKLYKHKIHDLERVHERVLKLEKNFFIRVQKFMKKIFRVLTLSSKKLYPSVD